MEIICEDRDPLVINQAAGLLTMSFHRDKSQTAERILTDYLRKGAARSHRRAYVVHRLDRETSGLLIFARTQQPGISSKRTGKRQQKKIWLPMPLPAMERSHFSGSLTGLLPRILADLATLISGGFKGLVSK
ncbi:MAG: rRNA synthase [Verrucomicrobiota bacterium]|jgi:hypothetical protein|nr:rRNA synthase [Verrucomicrobiota bacterium]MDK2962622.1 rRNA synthase [Verrucomicrobiota bacterium]